MKFSIITSCSLMVLCLFSSVLRAQDEAARIPIEITCDGENSYENGVAYAEGNVVVRYGSDVIYANEVYFYSEKGIVEARGNVRIFVEGQIFRGEYLEYKLDSGAVESRDFMTARDKIFAYGEEAFTPTSDKYVIKNGWLTTNNSENPSYRLKASTIEIYPDDSVVMKNVTIMLGEVPVMWIPYVSQGLGEQRGEWNVELGSTTRWGIFALGNYSFAMNEKWSTNAHFGYRGRRGFGGGLDFDFHPREGDIGEFRSFATVDNGFDIDSEARSSVPDEERYRFEYKQRFNITPDIYVIGDLNFWSDKFVTQDFFEDEFIQERVPDNFFDATYYDPNFTASLTTRFQIDEMFDTLERKPELLLEFKRQKIPMTPISYEGQSSISYLQYKFDEDNPIGTRPLDPNIGSQDSAGAFVSNTFSAYRYDSFHQFLYPRQYFNWLSFTPRVGTRLTHYESDTYTYSGKEEWTRGAFNAGFDASFKLSKTWFEIQDERFAIDGLRHVIQPYLNYGYTYVTKRPDQFFSFDNRYASTRAQPIDYSYYNSIDSIDHSNRLRHGVVNKLQTMRDGESVNLAELRTYADFEIDRGQYEFTRWDSSYSEIFNELTLHPLPWLEFDLHSAIGVADDSYHEVNSELTWQVHPSLEVELGQRFLRMNNDATFVDPLYRGTFFTESNQITTGVFWRLNENWQIAQDLIFEADEGLLQEQSYTLYRDLTHWNISATAKLRSNELIDEEFLVFFNFTLKAFPRASFEVGN